jgi:hypothetical protein
MVTLLSVHDVWQVDVPIWTVHKNVVNTGFCEIKYKEYISCLNQSLLRAGVGEPG